MAYSQGEANNWYFGEEAGINFTNGKVSALTNGKTYSVRGAATMSNSKGQLLFYTNGLEVRDSTHKITPNGSKLSGSNYGSALIVPRPSYPGLYYIFTANEDGGYNGLSYSEFDMSLNSGKGDIISGKKSLQLMSTVTARITAVRHANGKDFWVLSQLYNSDKIYAWQITSSGINPNPVISTSGLYLPYKGKFSDWGCMKASPDGTKIAFTVYTRDTSVIADFDAKNGTISNPWFFSSGYHKYSFAMEFSANSKYLYIGKMHASTLYQFDAKSPTLNHFIASQYRLDSLRSEISGMQLGPDNKIYLCTRFSNTLGVIHAPDSAVKSCRLKLNYLYLNGKISHDMLPQFIQSYFNPLFVTQGTCLGDSAWFSIGENSGIDSVLWNFNDPHSKSNTAKGNRVFHVFSDTGNFKVRAVAYKGSFSDTIYFDAIQKAYLGKLNELEKEVYKCFDDTITLNISKSNAQKIKWSTGSDSAFTRVADSGYVWVKKYFGIGCYAMDSIKVINYKTNILKGFVSLGKDITKCPEDSIQLSCKNSKAVKYSWSTGIFNKSIFVKQPTTISIKASFGGSCYATDTIEVLNYKLTKLTLGPDTGICPKQTLFLGYFEYAFDSYIWNNNSTSAFMVTDTTGVFWLKVKDSNGCFQKDTIKVFSLTAPKVNLGNDTGFCDKTYFVLDAKNKSVLNKYKWGTAKTIQTDTVNKTGKYWVKVSNTCGVSVDSIFLKFLTIPKALLPKDSIFCDSIALVLDAANSSNDVNYRWNTNANTQTILVKDTGNYKVIVTNVCGADSASIHISKCYKGINIKISKTCVRQPTYFSIPETIKVDSMKWDFGDTGSIENYSDSSGTVSHTYNADGIYTIKVLLFYKGKTDTVSSSITFISSRADFETSDVCEMDSVYFINKSTNSKDSIYFWKFGDGQSSSLVSPTHFYSIGGISKTFNVTLVSISTKGCADSITLPVTVSSNPNSDFSFTTNNNVFSFTPSQSGNTSYMWYFGNGDSSNLKQASYKYPKSGVYLVCLKSVNAANCVSKTCKEVSISVGISNIFKFFDIKIYPNPNSGNFVIEKSNKDILTVELFNQIGQNIHKVELKEFVNEINLKLATGIYLIRVTNGDYVVSQKIVVNN